MRALVKNFQSLREVDVEIRGITLITGSNNEGKTSFVRAELACLAGKLGDDFIHHGETETAVALSFDADEDNEAAEFLWVKKRGKGSKYSINGGTPLEKLGRRGVPLEILKNYGIREIDYSGGRERLMFWNQRQPPFLVDIPPTQVFDFVSRILEERKIIPVLKKMNTDRLQQEKDLIHHEGQITAIKGGLTTLEEQTAVLAYIPDHLELVETLEMASPKLAGIAQMLGTLGALRERYTKVSAIQEESEKMTLTLGDLGALSDQSRKVTETGYLVITLLNEKEAHNSLSARTQKAETLLKTLGDLEALSEQSRKISGISHLLDSRYNQRESLNNLGVHEQVAEDTFKALNATDTLRTDRNLLKSLGELKAGLTLANSQLDQKKDRRHQLEKYDLFFRETELQTLRKSLGTCPLCGADMEDAEL